jgi:hypothetical protein
MENVTITLTPRQRLALEWALMNEVDRLKESPSVQRGQQESVRTFESLQSILQIFEDKRDLVSAENALAYHLEETPDEHKAIAYCAKRVATLKSKIQN